MTAEMLPSRNINAKKTPGSNPVEVLGSGKERSPIPASLVLVPSPRIPGQMTLRVSEGKSFHPGDTVFVFVGPVTPTGDVYSFQYGSNQHINPINGEGRSTAGHFLNHSCEPTVAALPELVEVNGEQVPGFRVTALAELTPGTELGADYATWEEKTVIDVPCLCGSAMCRGKISGWKGLTFEQQAGLIGRGIVAGYLVDKSGEEQTASSGN